MKLFSFVCFPILLTEYLTIIALHHCKLFVLIKIEVIYFILYASRGSFVSVFGPRPPRPVAAQITRLYSEPMPLQEIS